MEWLGDMLNAEHQKLVHEIGKLIKWDVSIAGALCVEILQDVNDHKNANKINQFLLESYNAQGREEG